MALQHRLLPKGELMFRVMIALGAAYGLGHPVLDPYRPAALDKPLHGFYFDVNTAVGQCGHAVKNFDSAWAMQYLGTMVGRVKAQVHS